MLASLLKFLPVILFFYFHILHLSFLSMHLLFSIMLTGPYWFFRMRNWWNDCSKQVNINWWLYCSITERGTESPIMRAPAVKKRSLLLSRIHVWLQPKMAALTRPIYTLAREIAMISVHLLHSLERLLIMHATTILDILTNTYAQA